MATNIRTNFRQPGLVNPSTACKNKPFHVRLYVPKNGRLTLFRERAKIIKRGFGHHYWHYKGRDICPVHKQVIGANESWVISTK